MSSVVISGDTSGSVTLSAPAVAGTVTVTLPSTSGTMAVGGGTITTITTTSDITVQGVTVGRGAGAVSGNTALGLSALSSNSSGYNNVAGGWSALNANTTGDSSVAVGVDALLSNTTGSVNTATGSRSLRLNTTGSNNTAFGRQALESNTTASNNTAVGYQAGYTNITGQYNAFLGAEAGYASTAGNNTFIGYYAGRNTTTGLLNTFVGVNGAGYLVTTGSKNTILGGYSGNQGGLDIRTASSHIVLSDGDGNVRAYINDGGFLRCQGVYDGTTGSAANVVVFSDGAIYRSTSALKYKTDIRNLENIDIGLFRPVRYKSKSQIDDPTKDHIGIIADEAAEAGFQELITYGADGEVEGFQYERLTVVLLKAMQTLKAEFDAYKEAHP